MSNSCDVGVVDKTWEGDVEHDWFTAGNWSRPARPDARPSTSASRGNPERPGDRHRRAGERGQHRELAADPGHLGKLRIAATAQALAPPRRPRPRRLDDPRQPRLADRRGRPRWSGGRDLGRRDDHDRRGRDDVRDVPTRSAPRHPDAADQRHRHLCRQRPRRLQRRHLPPERRRTQDRLRRHARPPGRPGHHLALRRRAEVNVESGGTLTRSSGSNPSLITVPLDNDGTVSARPPRPASAARRRDGADLHRAVQRRERRVINLSAGTHKWAPGPRSPARADPLNSGPSTPRARPRSPRATSRRSPTTPSNTGTLTVNGTLDWSRLHNAQDRRRRDDDDRLRRHAHSQRRQHPHPRHPDAADRRHRHPRRSDRRRPTSTPSCRTARSRGRRRRDARPARRPADPVYGGSRQPAALIAGGTLTRTTAPGTSNAFISARRSTTTAPSTWARASPELAGGTTPRSAPAQFSAGTGTTLRFRRRHPTSSAAPASAAPGTVSVSGGEVKTSGTTSGASATPSSSPTGPSPTPAR